MHDTFTSFKYVRQEDSLRSGSDVRRKTTVKSLVSDLRVASERSRHSSRTVDISLGAWRQAVKEEVCRNPLQIIAIWFVRAAEFSLFTLLIERSNDVIRPEVATPVVVLSLVPYALWSAPRGMRWWILVSPRRWLFPFNFSYLGLCPTQEDCVVWHVVSWIRSAMLLAIFFTMEVYFRRSVLPNIGVPVCLEERRPYPCAIPGLPLLGGVCHSNPYFYEPCKETAPWIISCQALLEQCEFTNHLEKHRPAGKMLLYFLRAWFSLGWLYIIGLPLLAGVILCTGRNPFRKKMDLEAADRIARRIEQLQSMSVEERQLGNYCGMVIYIKPIAVLVQMASSIPIVMSYIDLNLYLCCALFVFIKIHNLQRLIRIGGMQAVCKEIQRSQDEGLHTRKFMEFLWSNRSIEIIPFVFLQFYTVDYTIGTDFAALAWIFSAVVKILVALSHVILDMDLGLATFLQALQDKEDAERTMSLIDRGSGWDCCRQDTWVTDSTSCSVSEDEESSELSNPTLEEEEEET